MRVNLPARAAAAELRRSQTRARLLQGAVGVIAAKGVEAASVEDFVVAAGVARGTFYNYFPTVDDLVAALMRHITDAMDGDLDAIAAVAASPATELAAICHYLFDRTRTDPGVGWVMLRLAGTPTSRQPALEARFNAFFRRGVQEGEFRDYDLAAVHTLVFGAMRMAQRDLLADELPATHPHRVVVLLLIALGVPADRAEEISHAAAGMIPAPRAAAG